MEKVGIQNEALFCENVSGGSKHVLLLSPDSIVFLYVNRRTELIAHKQNVVSNFSALANLLPSAIRLHVGLMLHAHAVFGSYCGCSLKLIRASAM